MKAYVFKRKRMKNGRVVTDRTYTASFRLDGDTRETRVALGVTDITVARQKLADLVRLAERERHGLVVPERLVDAAGKPLLDHLSDFASSLKARNRSKRYVRELSYRIRSVLAFCGWKYARDVTSDGFDRWRQQHPKGAKTLNEYQAALNGLFRWMVAARRLEHNPLQGVGRVDARGHQTFERRALTPDEFERLLQVAGKRRALYLAAVQMCVRRNTLRLMVWDDLHLHEPVPYALIRAETQKDRKPRRIDLRRDVVIELKAIKPEGVSGQARVFARLLPEKRLNWFRDDLRRAGIADKDAQGRRVDFHSLRHTACTWAGATGYAGKVLQKFTGHATESQLNRYVHGEQTPTFDLMNRMPWLGPYRDTRMESDDSTATKWVEVGTALGTPTAVSDCRKSSRRVTNQEIDMNAGSARKQGKSTHSGIPSHAVSQLAKNCGRQESNLHGLAPRGS